MLQVQEAEPSKFSTLTRARGRGGAPSSLPPLTDVLPDPALSTAVRYSTIGRNRWARVCTMQCKLFCSIAKSPY